MRGMSVLSLTACLVLAAGARADDQANLKAVVEKAIKASGGEEKLTKFKGTTAHMKGKFYGPPVGDAGLEFTGSMAAMRPDKSRFEMSFDAGGMKFTFLQIVNGGKGWQSINGEVKDMDKDGLAEARHTMYVARLETLVPLVKDKDLQLSPLGESKVDTRTVIGMQVASKGQRPVNLYFDKDSGLLAKVETAVKEPNEGYAEHQQETIMSDYKDVDGHKVAGKVTIKRDGKLYVEAETSDEKVMEKVDDSEFAKP